MLTVSEALLIIAGWYVLVFFGIAVVRKFRWVSEPNEKDPWESAAYWFYGWVFSPLLAAAVVIVIPIVLFIWVFYQKPKDPSS